MYQYILMGDIMGSRASKGKDLMERFTRLVNHINKKHEKVLLSPLTITLGDEFQGVVSDLKAGVDLLFDLEEALIEFKYSFKLRYVLYYGKIETVINKKIAHGMLGPGLTEARESIETLKKDKARFYIKTKDKDDRLFQNLFFLAQSFLDNWNVKDYPLISQFLLYRDYKIVADNLNKTRSLMWKREKSLKIREYFALKETVKILVKND